MATPFYELSQFAYLNLKESNPRTTFSLAQLYQSLDQSVKEEYLGLMTMFTVIDEESYQFLHSSIQEFLAAWWITKREKTEEVFAEHFNNDHFQLCLGFVAGLTHLEQESYQQYFNKELNLHCKRRPLFGLDHMHSYFCQNLVIRQQHIYCPLYSNKLNVLLLLLFESQNSKLCEVLSQNIEDHSLCLHAKESLPFYILFFGHFHNAISSPFDILCLNYFLRHFNTTWDYVELGSRNKQAVEVFASKQRIGQCIRLEIELHQDVKSIKKMLQTSFFHNLQECYITLNSSSSDIARMFQQLLKLQHLKILHFKMSILGLSILEDSSKISFQTDLIPSFEIEEQLSNSLLCELAIGFISNDNNIQIFNSLVKGVTRNRSIQTFSLSWRVIFRKNNQIYNEAIQQLLKDNHTLKALKLDISDYLVPPLNLSEVNVPLSALEIGRSEKLLTLAQCFKNLECLIVHQVYPPHNVTASPTFLRYPSDPSLQKHNQSLEHLPHIMILPNINPLPLRKCFSTPNLKKLTQPSDFISDINMSLCETEDSLLLLYVSTKSELSVLFHSHPKLKQLQLSLDAAKSVIELFTVLQNNTTLKVLRVKITRAYIFELMGPSLEDMLKLNQTIEHLELNYCHDIHSITLFSRNLPNAYLSFLISGLSHNTSLLGLSVPIPLTDTHHEQLTSFFNVVTNKDKIKELKVSFISADNQLNYLDDFAKIEFLTTDQMLRLLYGQGIPSVVRMLKSHTNMRLLSIKCDIFFTLFSQSYGQPKSNDLCWIKQAELFWQTIFLHPSLQYIRITKTPILEDVLKSQKKKLLDVHKQLKPLIPLPIIEMT